MIFSPYNAAGKFILNKKLCMVSELMQQVLDDVQSLVDKSEVILTVDPVSVDPNAIELTLTLTRSSFPHHATVCLSAEVMESPETWARSCQLKISLPCLLFRIKDQGRGIPVDKLDIIFERFQQIQVSDSSQKKGSRLGLAICKSVVLQHDGVIWAQSILGQGSTFYFTLPLIDVG